MQPIEHDPETRRLLAKTLLNVPDEPDPLTSSRSLARGTTIVGLMLEDLGDKRGGWKRAGGAVARFGQVVWALVELAAPRSLGQILFQYWTAVLYALSVLMVMVGLLTGVNAVTRGGLLVLCVAVVVNIVVEKLRRWMMTKDRSQLNLLWLIAPLLVSLIGGGYLLLSIYDLEGTMVQNGANPALQWNRAGALKTPSDVCTVLGKVDPRVKCQSADDPKLEANVRLMTASLGWQLLFLVCFGVAFLTLGWILATQFDRPYRAYACVVVPGAVAVISFGLETLQAYLSILGKQPLAPLYLSRVELAAGAVTVAVLMAQAIVVRVEAAGFQRVRT